MEAIHKNLPKWQNKPKELFILPNIKNSRFRKLKLNVYDTSVYI